MNVFSRLLLVISLVVAISGCQKIQTDYAGLKQDPASPQYDYTLDPNKPVKR